MRHARTFITSREKMHPAGVELYDGLLAAIASGELVPASKALPYSSAEFLTTPESVKAYQEELVAGAVAEMREHLDHLEGGLHLLLMEAKAGAPQKEIVWRVEEGLWQIERLRRLPACGEYVVGWRTMDSAPKDGRSVQLWYPWTGQSLADAPEGFQYIGTWHSPENGEDGWYDPVDWCAIGKGATHWKPLDAPPLTASTIQGGSE